MRYLRHGAKRGTAILTGPEGVHDGSTSAPTRSLQGALAGAAVIVVVTVVDAFVWKGAILIGLLILGPLVACTRSDTRDVLAVTLLALLAGVLLGVPDHVFGKGEHFTRLLIVAAGGGMALWISSIRASREHTADLLALQAAVARILTSADTLAVATPKLLAAIGGRLGWEVAALWTVRPRSNSIVCEDVWSTPQFDATRFVQVTRDAAFGPGEGLPGRVWASGRPVWVFDVVQDPDFRRSEVAAEAGLGAAFAFPIRGSTGVLGTIECFASAPRRPDGRLLDLMDALGGQLGDYVERKLAEQAVRESDARKTAMVQAALDCIVTMDSNGCVVEFNPAAERTFGYTAEEAIGRKLAELIVPPDLREAHRSGLARYLSTGEARVLDRRLEMRAVRKDGSELPVELTVTAIATDPPIFTGYIRDLTERREVEALQNRMTAIVESSDDAILSKDRDLIFRSWNHAAQRLYGLRRDGSVEPVGSPGTLIGFVPDPQVVDETIELQLADSLVLYTDGVSEARSPEGLFGEERLVDLLRSCAGLDAAGIAERIESDVLEFRDGARSDDLAVLVLRVREAPEVNGAGEAERLEPVRKAPA